MSMPRVGSSNSRISTSAASQSDDGLLLIASGEGAYGAGDVGRAHPHAFHQRCRFFMQLAPLDKAERVNRPMHGSAMLEDTGRPDDAILLALLRDQTDACADCHARTAQIDRLAVEGDAAGLGAVDPRDQRSNSVRPDPTRPARPRTSPLCRENPASWTSPAVGQVLNLHDDFGAGMADMAGMQDVAADILAMT